MNHPLSKEEPALKKLKIDNSNECVEDPEAIYRSLCDCLSDHDENWATIQEAFKAVCSEKRAQAEDLEGAANKELEASFPKEADRLQGILNELREAAANNEKIVPPDVAKKAISELTLKQWYIFEDNRIFVVQRNDNDVANCSDLIAFVIKRIEDHDTSRKEVQNKICATCKDFITEINKYEEAHTVALEEAFAKENERLQNALDRLLLEVNVSANTGAKGDGLFKAVLNARAELLVKQSYDFVLPESVEENTIELGKDCHPTIEKSIDAKWISSPVCMKVSKVSPGTIFLRFDLVNDQERVVCACGFKGIISYEAVFTIKGGDREGSIQYALNSEPNGTFSFRPVFVEIGHTYEIRMRAVCKGMKSEWSETVELVPNFSEFCIWKGMSSPSFILSFLPDHMSMAVTSKTNILEGVIGNASLPLNNVTSWNIKILKSKDNDGKNIFIGVAPSDINCRESYIYRKCGWYFNCYNSTLQSGPPHNYRFKNYGPRKSFGQYVHTGDSVGVVMDTAKGELSFVVNGVNLGVAFKGIPLDKPLVPCVILGYIGDSVELVC